MSTSVNDYIVKSIHSPIQIIECKCSNPFSGNKYVNSSTQ